MRTNSRLLLRGAAVMLVAGAAAGCSSQVTRFNSVDDVFTASTDNQRQIINGQVRNQPFPGDAVASAPVQPVQTAAVSRNDLPPPVAAGQVAVAAPRAPAPAVDSKPFATASDDLPPVSAPPTRAERPMRVPSARSVDPAATGSVDTAPAAETSSAAVGSDPAGWSRAGGTQVTARQGETVYNLSRRYGVPADVISQVNGLPDGASLKSGQKVVIPTYVYSKKAPVSAPGNDRNVADAKASNGTRFDVPADKVPLPSRAPDGTKVAVLPKEPKTRDQQTASATSTDATNAKKVKSEASASAAKPKISGGGYTVQSGDTLSAIAKKTGVKVADLKAANGMQDGILKIGQTLKVPQGGSIIVAEAPKIDKTTTASTGTEASKPAAYQPPKSSAKVMEQAETSAEVAPNATGIERMRWPVRGRVISSYAKGGGKANDGIDIAVPEGTAVKAAENGVVIYAGDGLKEFGNTVLVRHENGLVTVYGHASELKVQRGQKVKRGQDIAVSGMSGGASAPKLHFEVRKNSAPVDPTTYLE